MAKFTSNYDIEGTLYNQSFYKKLGKIIARKKGGVSGDRIKQDAAFARTRENGTEFGNAATAGKTLRYAFAPFITNTADSLLVSRLTQVMARIKNQDTVSPRGLRNVATGIATPEGKALLKDFNFNNNAMLKTILRKPYILDAATGIITIAGLVPLIDVIVPEGATHITFTGAAGTVDFANNTYDTDYTNAVTVPYNAESTDIRLIPGALPSGAGPLFYMLHIAFFQQINTVQYPLNNGGYNALSIIDVQ